MDINSAKEGKGHGTSGRESAAERRMDRIQKHYDRILGGYERASEARESFLERNDQRLAKVRAYSDAALTRRREKTDGRIRERRGRIDEKYVGSDAGRRERFAKAAERTDRFLEDRREKQDERIRNHREKISRAREEQDRKYRQSVSEARIRQQNRRRKDEKDLQEGKLPRSLKTAIAGAVAAAVLIIAAGVLLPGGFLRKKSSAEDSRSGVELIPMADIEEWNSREQEKEKKYAAIDIPEEQILWDVLMKHFGGNKTAVLGVMCNIMEESRIRAACLEDYNNSMWDIDDLSYTEEINQRNVGRKDFTESRYNGQTNGYYNKYEQWVNRDGGYGYAQVTSFDKKDELYLFADQWFGPGGEGEEYLFNIADPQMQANFLIHILESDEYSSMDYMIRNAENVVDACYYWLKTYEVPYDPYCDNYYTLSFRRADSAGEIERICTQRDTDGSGAGSTATEGSAAGSAVQDKP